MFDSGTGTNMNVIRSGSTPLRSALGRARTKPWNEVSSPPSLALAPGSLATSERLRWIRTDTVLVSPEAILTDFGRDLDVGAVALGAQLGAEVVGHRLARLVGDLERLGLGMGAGQLVHAESQAVQVRRGPRVRLGLRGPQRLHQAGAQPLGCRSP